LCIARDPEVRLREIAVSLAISERRTYAIVTDLTDAGYVLKSKEGRRNRYVIQAHLPLPEFTGREQAIGAVLDLLAAPEERRRFNRRSGD
jgi:predicted DNA-binding transcriptional regulator